MPCESSSRRLPPYRQESGVRIGGPSNARLQRTRVRPSGGRSPLSRKPLGRRVEVISTRRAGPRH